LRPVRSRKHVAKQVRIVWKKVTQIECLSAGYTSCGFLCTDRLLVLLADGIPFVLGGYDAFGRCALLTKIGGAG
jgi:hypothetical protein